MGDNIRQQEGTAGPQGPHPPMQSGEISQCGAALFRGLLSEVKLLICWVPRLTVHQWALPKPAVKAVRIDQRTG